MSGLDKIGGLKVIVGENLVTCDKPSHFSPTFFPDEIYESLDYKILFR